MSLIYVFNILCPLIPVTIGIYRWKYIQHYKYLFLFSGYGLLNEIVMYVLREMGSDNFLFLGHIYAFVSFTLLCLFFKVHLKGNIKGYWFKGLIVFYWGFCVLQLLIFQSIKDYPSIQLSVLAIVMVLFSIIYFHKIMVEEKLQNLKKEPMIWFIVALLFYYTGSLFHFILFNLMLDYSHQILSSLGDFFAALNFILYSFIGIGFWMAKK